MKPPPPGEKALETPSGLEKELRNMPEDRPMMAENIALGIPLGLDPEFQYIPEDNPLTAEKIELGRMLYFDKRLSADNTVSCASCHHPKFGFTDGMSVSIGINGQKGGRSVPTVVNRLFSVEQFWDGRAEDLEAQALGPIQNPIEMGNTLEVVVEKLNAIEGYRKKFESVFGTGVSSDGIAKAIASFERTVLSPETHRLTVLKQETMRRFQNLLREVSTFSRIRLIASPVMLDSISQMKITGISV